MMIRAKFGIWALLVSVVCWPPSAAAAATPNQLGNAKISLKTVMDAAYSKVDCRRLIGAAERRHRIPAQLLSAIALTESGRWMVETGAIIAWPWTVYAQGEGNFHPNQAAASAAVKHLRARGVTNIDVGCMQINLQYHAEAFPDAETALTPGRNIDYAADLLRRLYNKHHSWLQAVAYYHSATKSLNIPYRRKVMARWYKERTWAINERRRLVQAAYNRRRVGQNKRIKSSGFK